MLQLFFLYLFFISLLFIYYLFRYMVSVLVLSHSVKKVDVVSKKRCGGKYKHKHYETFTSMSGTILPTMCQIVVVIQ